VLVPDLLLEVSAGIGFEVTVLAFRILQSRNRGERSELQRIS
jgi:hypothetical protein